MVEKKGYTNVIFHEGTISTLYGLPGSGKTNLMVFLSECGAKNGFNVWTIIHFFNTNDIEEAISEGLLPPGIHYIPVPQRIHTVKRISDLLLGVLEHKKNTTILDEAGIFASTRAPMAKKLRNILNLSYIIRHLRSSFVYITQTERSIPPEMRESLVSYEMNIRKTKIGYRLLTIKKRSEFITSDGREMIDFIPIDQVKGIPLTKLPWDGHYIPKFDFDIDLDEAWNRLGEYDSLKVREVGGDIIRKMVEELQEESDRKEKRDINAVQSRNEKGLARYVEMVENNEFKNNAEAAGILSNEFGMSFSWAYNIIKMGKNKIEKEQ